MKPRKKQELTAQQIANVAGVSLTLVNRKLSQGRSPRQIIAEAVTQEERVAQKLTVNVTDVVNGHAANGALFIPPPKPPRKTPPPNCASWN